MSANISNAYTSAPPTRFTGLRVAAGVLGAAALAVGIVLLFHPTAAAHVLAVLIGISFIVGGLLEIAVGWNAGSRVAAVVLGGLLIVAGALAIAWPQVTLWTLVLITGLTLIVHGIGRIAVAVTVRHEIPSWGWLVAAGVVNVAVGVLAIAWPTATVLVLSLILGIQIVMFGAVLLIAAFWHPTETIA